MVWVGEFDQSEFPHYQSHAQMNDQVYVTEVIELGSTSTLLIEP
jgi:hypothetical protein